MVRKQWAIDPAEKHKAIDRLVDNLAPLRAKADITQEELSSLIGISRQTYYSIETRKRSLTWGNYLSLIFFFDTNSNTHNLLHEIGAYPEKIVEIMKNQ